MCGDSLMVKQDLFQSQDGGSTPTSPLQFKIVELNPYTASEYNMKWHSRLPKIPVSNITRNKYYVCYGASFNNQCYAVAIWSSPVSRFLATGRDAENIIELRRLAICSEAPKNTASRMISIMIKMVHKKFPKVTRFISYQDTEVHKGIIYKASGWKRITKTTGASWGKSRKRNKDQTTADKIRWEYSLAQNKEG